MGLHSSGQNILLPLRILISPLLIYQSGNKEIFFCRRSEAQGYRSNTKEPETSYLDSVIFEHGL